MKNTKFSKSVSEKLDSTKSYGIDEAMSLLMELKRSSFAESVDVAFNLGVDPRHAEENIRLSLILPHGIGRSVSVLAIVNPEKEAEAKEAGADFVGSEEYLEKIKSGWTDVDKIVVTPTPPNKRCQMFGWKCSPHIPLICLSISAIIF